MKSIILKWLPAVFFALATTALATGATTADTVRPRLSTDEVENQITLDREANPFYESRFLAPIAY